MTIIAGGGGDRDNHQCCYWMAARRKGEAGGRGRWEGDGAELERDRELSAMISLTVRLGYVNDGPRSPCRITCADTRGLLPEGLSNLGPFEIAHDPGGDGFYAVERATGTKGGSVKTSVTIMKRTGLVSRNGGR